MCHQCLQSLNIYKVCSVCSERMFCNCDVLKHDTTCHKYLSNEAMTNFLKEVDSTCNLPFSENDNDRIPLKPHTLPMLHKSLLNNLGSESHGMISFDTFIRENSVIYFSNLCHYNHLHSMLLDL